MGESDLHLFLKSVASAWLSNQGCFLIGEEVVLINENKERVRSPTRYHDNKEVNEIDNKIIIDVVGAGHFEIGREEIEVEEYKGIYEHPIYRTQIHKKWILRGVEVKISKSDFKNGYSCSGCNFNYLIMPSGLVNPNEVSKEVGIITFNQEKFQPFYEESVNHFILEGVRLIRRPIYQDVSDDIILEKMAEIAYRQSKKTNIELGETLKLGKSKNYRFLVSKTNDGYHALQMRPYYIWSGRGKTPHAAIKEAMDKIDECEWKRPS